MDEENVLDLRVETGDEAKLGFGTSVCLYMSTHWGFPEPGLDGLETCRTPPAISHPLASSEASSFAKPGIVSMTTGLRIRIGQRRSQ